MPRAVDDATEDAMEAAVHAVGGESSGLMKKLIFVTTPMWITTVLLFCADIKPLEVKPAQPPFIPIEPSGNLTAQVAALKAALQQAQEQATIEAKKVKSLEEALANHGRPVLAWFDSIPGQGAVALAAGALGVLAVAGPSSYVRCFLAIVGSFTAGLFASACASYFSGVAASPFWMDAVYTLLKGNGSVAEYVLWGTLLFLGILRWATGWECGLYDVVDEVEMAESGQVTVLAKPLLPQPGQAAAGVGPL